MMEKEPKTSQELEHMILDLIDVSGVVLFVHKAEGHDFAATVLVRPSDIGLSDIQSTVESICDELRLKYTLLSK